MSERGNCQECGCELVEGCYVHGGRRLCQECYFIQPGVVDEIERSMAELRHVPFARSDARNSRDNAQIARNSVQQSPLVSTNERAKPGKNHV